MNRPIVAMALSTLAILTFLSPVVMASPENTTADAVLGQADFASVQANRGLAVGAGATTLSGNRGLTLDLTSGRLWVADTSNNRVLGFASAATFANGAEADIVLGQANFNENQQNRGNANPAANTLSGPRSVAVTSDGRLYVADSGNFRVLRYPIGVTSGADAVQVLGQPDFATANQAAANAATDSNMGNPDGIAVDSHGNLYLADLFLKRVLVFNNPATNDAKADIVIGQPTFAATDANQGGGPAANTLFNPEGVALDSADNLYVADQENHRVLLFKPPLSTNMSATQVYGQPNFTTNTAGTTKDKLDVVVGVCIDPLSGNLYAADSTNMRIMEYTSPLTGVTPSRVFGQLGDFTTKVLNKGGASADSINDVGGVACDSKGNLYAGDRNNNRALRFNVAPPSADNGGGGSGSGDNGTGDGTGTGGGNGAPTMACGTCGMGAGTMMPLAVLGLMAQRRRIRRGFLRR